MLQLIMSLMELSEEKRKEICILLMSTTLLNSAHIEQTAVRSRQKLKKCQ